MTTGHGITLIPTDMVVGGSIFPKNGLANGHSEPFVDKGLLLASHSSFQNDPETNPWSVSNCFEPLQDDLCYFMGSAHLCLSCFVPAPSTLPRSTEYMFHNQLPYIYYFLAGDKVFYICMQQSDSSLGLSSENKSDCFTPGCTCIHGVHIRSVDST